MKIIIGLLLVSLLSSCFSRYEWRKIDGNSTDLGRDSYECEINAVKVYPTKVVKQEIIDKYQTPRIICPTERDYPDHYKKFKQHSYKNNYHLNKNNCLIINGERGHRKFKYIDINKESRDNLKNNCLKSKGWIRYKVN